MALIFFFITFERIELMFLPLFVWIYYYLFIFNIVVIPFTFKVPHSLIFAIISSNNLINCHGLEALWSNLFCLCFKIIWFTSFYFGETLNCKKLDFPCAPWCTMQVFVEDRWKELNDRDVNKLIDNPLDLAVLPVTYLSCGYNHAFIHIL